MIQRGKESQGKKRESKYEKESEDEKTSVKIKREREKKSIHDVSYKFGTSVISFPPSPIHTFLYIYIHIFPYIYIHYIKIYTYLGILVGTVEVQES